MTLPTGTLTFLLTDIEGSTRLWQAHEDVMALVVARHDDIVSAVVSAHGGFLIKSKGEGDSTFSVFTRPTDAATAALAMQHAIETEQWPDGVSLRIRAGLHTGEAELRDGDYYGTTVNRAARIKAVAHGGQTITSETTADLVRDSDVPLRPLGQHRLKDLERPERLFQIGVGDFPAPRSLDAFVQNLPSQRTSFVGREREIRVVRELLDGHRLVTLIGVGGCGKTRLALQVAAESVDEFSDGVFFVDLAPVADPGVIAEVVAVAIGIRSTSIGAGGGGPVLSAVIDVLSVGRQLMVLDNCEHLIDGCAAFADELLERCAELRIVATSREALGITGEQSFTVPSLSIEGADGGESECVRLFYDRAIAVRPDFHLSADEAPCVGEICRRLDGIPLAVELAAAQVPFLSAQQIADRLNDRFNLLTGPRRRVQRQQTLAAALDWSHDLLSWDEQRVFRALSVFPGSFTLEAAEGVVGEPVVRILRALVAKSLVVTEDVTRELRYRMLETVRLYAEQKAFAAGESEEMRRRHRDYFLAWLERIPPERSMGGGNYAMVFEHANIRAALEYSEKEGRIDLVARVASSAGESWLLQFPDEGQRWLDAALERRGELDPKLLFYCLGASAQVANTRLDVTRARALVEEALAMAPGEPDVWGVSIGSLLLLYLSFDIVAGVAGAIERQAEFGERVNADADAISGGGRGIVVAYARNCFGMGVAVAGDFDRALALLAQSEEAVIGTEHEYFAVMPASRRVILLHVLGRHDEALPIARWVFERSAEERVGERPLVDPSWDLMFASSYGLALAGLGRFEEARTAFQRLTADRRRSQSAGPLRVQGASGELVLHLAAAAIAVGDGEAASILLAVCNRELGHMRTPVSYVLFAFCLGKVREITEPDVRRQGRERGGAMSISDALEYGISVLREPSSVSTSRGTT